MIYLEYRRRDGAETALEIPLQPGESWERGFARLGPVIVAAMGITPAPEMDPRRWAELVKKTGTPSP